MACNEVAPERTAAIDAMFPNGGCGAKKSRDDE